MDNYSFITPLPITELSAAAPPRQPNARDLLQRAIPDRGALQQLVDKMKAFCLAGKTTPPTAENLEVIRTLSPSIYQEAKTLCSPPPPARHGFRSASPPLTVQPRPIRSVQSVPAMSGHDDEPSYTREANPPLPATAMTKTKKVKGKPKGKTKGTRAPSKAWSREECHRLEQLVAKYPKKTQSRWRRIAVEMGTDRTADQCSQKWNRVLDPTIRKKDPWRPAEDDIILQHVRESAARGKRPSWARLAAMLPGRPDTIIRYRYEQELQAKGY